MGLKRFAAAVAVGALVPAALLAQPVQVDVNPASALQAKQFTNISSIGWYFTPTSTFFLNAIQTRFNPARGTNVDRTVSVELWSDRPTMGGSLLRSANFQSNSALGMFGGGAFAPILFQSGIQYFIGFRNVQGMGVNYTKDPLALSLGFEYFSLAPVAGDNFDLVGDRRSPSLRLIGSQVSTVPEPMTMTLLATGLAAMGGVGLVRRRNKQK